MCMPRGRGTRELRRTERTIKSNCRISTAERLPISVHYVLVVENLRVSSPVGEILREVLKLEGVRVLEA
jgi:hypothetical protein